MNTPPSQRRPPRREAPQRDPAYATAALDEVRRMRTGLIEEESRVSYWRRIIQARIDLLTSRGGGSPPLEQLSRLLADSRLSHRRVAALSVGVHGDVPALPDLAELWNRVATDDADERHDLLQSLQSAEEALSAFRRTLHERIDGVTAELIARYREDPHLALTALHERTRPA